MTDAAPIVHHGDALTVLPTLDAASVDAVLADPPYSSGGAYRGDRVQSVRDKYFSNDSTVGARSLPTFPGDARDQRSYLAWSVMWMSEALRVTRPGGLLMVATDWRQLPTITDAVQCAGWVWRGVATWCKPNGRNQPGRLANNMEFYVWATAGPFTRSGATQSGFVAEPTVPPAAKIHPTEKPMTLVRHLVRATLPRGTVLDPFAGSGSTGVACATEQRGFVGIELDAHYHAIARDRVTTAYACTG